MTFDRGGSTGRLVAPTPSGRPDLPLSGRVGLRERRSPGRDVPAVLSLLGNLPRGAGASRRLQKSETKSLVLPVRH